MDVLFLMDCETDGEQQNEAQKKIYAFINFLDILWDRFFYLG